MQRLSMLLGGPTLWIKRDDCTGLATGGNKTRKLEYLMADALAQGADTVITQGATQSNHARQTAAIACKLGLACHIILEDRTGYTSDDYKHSGNVFLDHLFGAQVSEVPGGSAWTRRWRSWPTACADGRRPYVIPGGGSNPIGALGYVTCALELIDQANNLGLDIDHLVHATGSAGTQAGLVAGLEGARSGIPVLGIGVRAPPAAGRTRVRARRADRRTARRAGRGAARGGGGQLRLRRPRLRPAHAGHGRGGDAAGAHRRHPARPGVLGQGMAGLLDLIRQGHFKAGQNIVFLHTGGAVGLYGYRNAFAAG
jgi:L-cysteate sulfo-lyase